MRIPKYKVGDLVTCSSSEECEQPMRIAGVSKWFIHDNLVVYEVTAVHRKKGNTLVVKLTEEILQPYMERLES